MNSTSLHHSFDITLASKYGIEEAILIHHFQHWIRHNKKLKRNKIEGRTWTYQTFKEIAAHFPYLNYEKVKYITEILVQKQVLKKGTFNQRKGDKTLWFAFSDEDQFLPKIEGKQDEPEENPLEGKGKFPDPMDSIDKCVEDDSHRERENSLRSGKIPSALPHTKTETETVNIHSVLKGSDIAEMRVVPPIPNPTLTVSAIAARSLPFHAERKITAFEPRKDFYWSLSPEEKSFYHEAMNFCPPQGPKLEGHFVTASIKQFGLEKTREAFEHSRQSCVKNPIRTSFGRMMRVALNKGFKAKGKEFFENKDLAQKVCMDNPDFKALEKYVAHENGWSYDYSQHDFVSVFLQKVDSMRAYV